MFPWLVKFRTSWLHTKYALAASGTAIPIWVGIQARLGNEMKTPDLAVRANREDRKSTRLNSGHTVISYAVFCLKQEQDTADFESPFDPTGHMLLTAQPSTVEFSDRTNSHHNFSSEIQTLNFLIYERSVNQSDES